jgi:hypothetical protein
MTAETPFLHLESSARRHNHIEVYRRNQLALK